MGANGPLSSDGEKDAVALVVGLLQHGAACTLGAAPVRLEMRRVTSNGMSGLTWVHR